MSTPTKFNQGGVPRTRTGLVPTSYSRTLDNLAFQLEELPTKPSQPKYKYRGDYVNERNRKILHERKLAQRQRQQSLLLDRSNQSSSVKSVDSFGSTIINSSTDNTNKDDKSHPSENTKNQWDSYCKHISCHKLSENEELSRMQNKKKFVSFLRCEALKRQGRSPIKNEEVQEITVIRKKKPPVPRLSRLARSDGNKDNKENRENDGKNTTTSRSNTMKAREKNAGRDTSKVTSKPKVGYLDFISKKADTDEPPFKSSVEEITNTSKHKQSDSTNDEDVVSRRESNTSDEDRCDDSKFRIQIERIVERAAEMVLKEQHDAQASSLDETNTGDTSNGTSDSSPGIDHRNEKSTGSILDNNNMTQLQQQKFRLSMLEDQVRSMSSSVVTDHSSSLGPSHIEQATRSTSSMMVPRSQVHPVSAPVLWQQCFGQKSVADLLQSIDSSSYTSNSFFTCSDSSDVRALKHLQAHDTGSMAIVDENETVTTEVQPRMQAIHPSQALENQCPSLDSCPEEIVSTSVVKPCTEPLREFEWEDEPLPRGYEHNEHDTCENTCDAFDIGDIYPRTAEQTGNKPESLVDELCSLLG